VFARPALRKRSFATLEDWLETSDLPAASTFGEKLVSLGVSAETFRGETDDLVDLFVHGGIPRLPARDLVKSATKFFAKQHELASLPLAVFWDAENVPIPAKVSGKECHRKMQSSLSGFGALDLLNVYLDVNAQSLPFAKRSDLQLSGWHIIDTPHRGVGGNRKEVADKMIIVDAMFYAMQRSQTGATLCFITGDADFAYLLSRLQMLQKLRTIVVYNVNPTLKTVNMLEDAATHVLSWADVLGTAVAAPPPPVLALAPAPTATPACSTTSSAAPPPSFSPPQTLTDSDDEDLDDEISSTDEPDSVALLISILRKLDSARDSPGEHKRSLVGSMMKQVNPVRFRAGSVVKAAVEAAVKGNLVEVGGERDWLGAS
jgi:hypothetical protein